MKRALDWLESRLGWRAWTRALSDEMARPIPSHVHWGFTLGSAAGFLFCVLAATGVLLALNYSAAIETAHGSVREITHEHAGGWLIRSLHYWAANLLLLVLVAHALRSFVDGAYRAPRELTWVFGAAMLLTALALCFTGDFLPLEETSYWATTVATGSLEDLPALAAIVRGGDAIGDGTISRFQFAHVWILPAVMTGLIWMHLRLVRRLGIAPRAEGAPTTPFSSHLHREILSLTFVLAILVTLAVLAPREVGPRFDPSRTPPGVRPNWYFLPMYQTLKYFPRLPGLLLINLGALAFAALPFLDRSPSRGWTRRRFAVFAGLAAFAAVCALGLLGYVSERSFVLFGGEIRFDIYGMPE
jgi:ubiquinol-cytochrome c reductase cytochrome b subunit